MTQLPNSFAALGDATRLSIVERLLREGERTAGELCEGVEISAPAVSRHLKVLREAGLVSQRVEGPKRIYAANPAALGVIGHWALAHRGYWDGALARLAAAVEEDGDA